MCLSLALGSQALARQVPLRQLDSPNEVHDQVRFQTATLASIRSAPATLVDDGYASSRILRSHTMGSESRRSNFVMLP